jgi:hypothetical protein
MDRRLVAYEPEASHRLSTGLCTHGAPHMSKGDHRLPMQWSLPDGSSQMSRRQATVCPPGSVHMHEYQLAMMQVFIDILIDYYSVLYTWVTSYKSMPTILCPTVVLYRRVVPNEPEASHRLSTGLCTHGAPHMSQRPTTVCTAVVNYGQTGRPK